MGVAPGYSIYPLRGSRVDSAARFFRSLQIPTLLFIQQEIIGRGANSGLVLSFFSFHLTEVQCESLSSGWDTLAA
jgi:hypothetical protein